MKRRKSSGALPLLLTGAGSAAIILGAKKLASALNRSGTDLRQKVVLITGGSRCLGFALAQEFGRHGSRLALCARDNNELERACTRLHAENIEAASFLCDITNQSEVASLVQRVLDHFGRIDILINNAGMIKVGPLDSFDVSDFEYAMNVMFWAPVHLSLAVLPHMKQCGGHIVNITSVGGRVSVPHLLPYSCAKFALVGFSTGLSSELKGRGIHVLTVVPGLMRTGSYLNAEFTGEAKQEFAWFSVLGNLPLVTVAAGSAARRVRRAVEKQKYNCTISLPAKLLISLESLFPGTTRAGFELITRTLLPASSQHTSATGKAFNPTFGKLFQAVTALGKAAALRFNE